MNLAEMTTKMQIFGYGLADAQARVCQDVILKAIEQSSLSKNVTIKGGVVMRSVTNNIRRATQDLDIDFIRYSLSDEAIDVFVEKLNCLDGIFIKRVGDIEELRQQEYKGKRVYIYITDREENLIESKIDLGVHKHLEIEQEEYCFDIAFDDKGASLLINSREQMFAEKLRSLLKFGSFSTRYKDIYDMYYQCGRMNKEKFSKCLSVFILDDPGMRENDMSAIVKRIKNIFSDRTYKKRVDRSDSRWLDDDIEVVFDGILNYLNDYIIGDLCSVVDRTEFNTLLVQVDTETLTPQEKSYYHRMLTTLKAVDVEIVELLEEKDIQRLRGRDYSKVLALVTSMTMLVQLKALGLPVVYYSHTCQGGHGADMLLMSFGEIGFDFFQQIFDRHHGQPWVIAETARCVIRESLVSDLDDFYEIYAQPSVAAYMEPLSYDYQEEQDKLRAYIKNQYPFYGFGTWTILDHQTGQVIGRAGLEIRDDRDGLELGYLLREEYQGQGLGYEVCQRILAFAKEQLEITDVYVKVAATNEASIRLAKKLGVTIYVT